MIQSLYEKFQHWSGNGSIYILSDTHFNDSDCEYMDSSWPSAEEHIKLINSIVHKNDTLIILGDVGDISCVTKLNANYKILIQGNHDTGKSNYSRDVEIIRFNADEYTRKDLAKKLAEEYPGCKICLKHGYETTHAPFEFWEGTIDNNLFNEVYNGPLFISDKILLSHEPINNLDFCINIHGHNHAGEMKPDIYHLNVASNVCNYEPISLGKEIKNGLLSNIDSIHRQTIDSATERKKAKSKQ